MQCRDFREVADSYLSDELLVETNHDVIAHLETCADCRRELAARRQLRTTLRASFANAEELRMPSEFATRLQRELRAVNTSRATLPPRRVWLIAASFLVVATFGVVVVWLLQRAQTTSHIASGRPRQELPAAEKPAEAQPQTPDLDVDASAILARMSELAAGDHRDCAIGHRLPDSPIGLEEAGGKYDRAYLNLTKAVMSRRDGVDDVIDLVMAHACLFKGHWFAHIVFRHQGRLVSLLVTRSEDAGAVTTAKGTPANDRGQVTACPPSGGYQISGFRTEQHVVFVVSDLDETENLAIARKLAPSVYEHLAQAERVA